jgi:hypothetical protein
MIDIIVIIGLFINGLLFPIQSSEIPEINGYVSAPTYAGTQIIIAHADMAGKEFSKLKEGDTIQKYYSDGTHDDYVVTSIEYLIADNPYSPELSLLYKGKWTYVLDVLRDKSENGMTLYTCWYEDGIFVGRVFVNLDKMIIEEYYEKGNNGIE